MQVTKTDKGLIKAWTDGIEVENAMPLLVVDYKCMREQ